MNTSALFYSLPFSHLRGVPLLRGRREQIEVLQVGNLSKQVIIVKTRGQTLGGIPGILIRRHGVRSGW